MKKSIIIACLLIFFTLLSACQNIPVNNQEKEPSIYDKITNAPIAAEYIGKDKEAVLSKLGIKSDELSESKVKGLFYLSGNYANEYKSFSMYFLFDMSDKSNCLYGVGYEYITDYDNDNILHIVQDLQNTLIDKYGEPSTYEGLKNRITDIKSISDCKFGDIFKDTWDISNKKFSQIILSMECTKEQVKINILYK